MTAANSMQEEKAEKLSVVQNNLGAFKHSSQGAALNTNFAFEYAVVIPQI